MRTVKIGLYDEERSYAEKLSAYLNRKGNGKWIVSAYTNETLLERDAKETQIDMISGTNRQVLYKIRESHRKIPLLWLRETNKAFSGAPEEFPSVYRYQSAAAIAQALEEMVNTFMVHEKNKIPIAAVYSPVGRCGKTSLAMHLVKQGQYGRWLYIGMEDYSFLWARVKEPEDVMFSETDSFLYYIKEQNDEQLSLLMRESQGIIPSAFSPFDTKCLEKEDFQWLLEWLQGMEGYAGFIFDFGTGVMSEISILTLFDYIIVPFVQQEKELQKLEQFNDLINAYGLSGLNNRLLYVNMESEKEQNMILEKIGGGRWEI